MKGAPVGSPISGVLAEITMQKQSKTPRRHMDPRKLVRIEGLLLVLLLLPLTDGSATNEDKNQTSESDITGLKRSSRAAVPIEAIRWPDGVVPYIIDEQFFSNEELGEIKEAIKTWNEETCVQIRPYSSGDNSWVKITDGHGCNTEYAGFSGRSGEQLLRLSSHGCRFYGLYVHELGHVLGLDHEHIRADRDKFVDVDLDSVSSDYREFFEKKNAADLHTYGTPYDLQSIMHYGPDAFSINADKSPLTVKNPAIRHVLKDVSSKDISFWDARAISKHYGCEKQCKKPPTCPSPGFVDKNCKCQVPSVFSKRRCKDRLSKTECTKLEKQLDCIRRQSYMTVNCRDTCGFCFKKSYAEIKKPKRKCDDFHDKCSQWQKAKQCTKNAEYMKRTCPKSCGVCTDSTDESKCRDSYIIPEDCQQWAARGECQQNPYWMAKNCAKSCGRCTDSTDETTDNSATCKDTYVFPIECVGWAARGECQKNPIWMSANCAKSCGRCGGSTDETTDNSAACKDIYAFPKECVGWAARGECQKNPIWMSANCAKSCGKCSETNTNCKDLNEHCPQWQKANECKKNPGYMEPNCPKSCGLCTDSTDENTDNSATCKDTYFSPQDCIGWAARGECQKNPIWMSANCAKSCGKCSETNAKFF
ncbi:metalloendopeptidase activity [Sparganum proliferum]